MKKFICITLCVLMALATMTSLVACGGKTVKLGLGLHVATPTATSASEDGNGKAQATVTIAAVTLDAEGKIVAISFDVVQPKSNWDEAVVETQTKLELKEGYGMKAISPIGKEWYEQTAAFCAFITGKTLNEAIAVAVNPGETDVIASCTIGTEDFLKLIVKAGL